MLLGIVCYYICFARKSILLCSFPFIHAVYSNPSNRTNHITAVLSDDPIISPLSTDEIGKADTHQQMSKATSEPGENFQEFAARVGFHKTMVSLLQRMGFLYGVVDVFTQKFLPDYRDEFLAIC
jgi:hypothetical protein